VNGSLRRRLFVWLSASIVVMGAATAALSFALSYREANDLQDTQLRQVAAVLAAQASITHAGRFTPRDNEDAETHFVVKALDAPVESRDPMIDVFLPATLHPGLQSLEASGVDWRVMVSRNAGGQAFGVAQRQTVRDEDARDSALLALVPMLVLVPLLLLIVSFALRRGFAPLVALSREVDQADGGHLAALEPSRVPLEALPLVHAVNRLLARLGRALDQQRRMVADAAHELRTPVAATRVQADNLAHADLPPEARSRLELLQRGLARTSELIEQLLKLARVQGAPSVVHPFALEAVIRVAIEDSLPLAQSRGVDLGCLPMDFAEVRGDSLHAYALVRNVIDNAVRYTASGGAVDVSVKVLDGHVVLTVEDTGPGIEPSQRERVFEPFYRIPGSQQLGSGLGLAIVRSAAQALGGTIELSGRRDGANGLRVTYRQRIE
jgi:two-component system OmpR family sensor kinase